MAKDLVIVESPAKAKTIGRILGHSYVIRATKGHVRDLPRGFFGIEVAKDFKPRYQVLPDRKKVVEDIKEAAKDVGAVYLATDPDREGEAIAWHVLQAARLDSQVPTKRVAFHEITEQAVKDAFKHPRSLDLKLVEAQQARRILDRLVGYRLSPLLWRKVQGGLSAGRVQSAALRLILEREQEVAGFVPREFWTIEAELQKLHDGASPVFKASLVNRLGKKTKLDIANKQASDAILADLREATYRVMAVTQKETSRKPVPPFITSTLQQEAWRKLRFSASKTMLIAQQLYEGLPLGKEGSVGLITYMRTDSTHVAASAVAETRRYIEEIFGKPYLPDAPRAYTRKVKAAQEAHEAIRPTSAFRHPEAVGVHLNRDQKALYELIWKRMVSSQMSNAVFTVTTVDIEARGREAYLFRASGSVLKFPGYLTLYVETADDDNAEDGQSNGLPVLSRAEVLKCVDLSATQHFTQPPPRYSEASLVKALEEKGIGRPSTYAPTVSVIQERGYVERLNGYLKPTQLGTLVNSLLIEHFPSVVDLDFTARMENELDQIARGERQWVPLLREFYGPFSQAVALASQRIEKVPDEVSQEVCERCGKPMVIKSGRYGRFLACSGFPQCRNTRRLVETTGVRCPTCGGDLVQRKARGRGKVFYGCSNYPQCTFAINQKPLPEPCPNCQGLLVQSGKSQARCTKCKTKRPLSELQPAPAAMEASQ